MVSIRSTSIASADYDENTEELVIIFHNGREYSYSGVPKDVYEGLVKASSPGAYYNAVIRNQF